jgi:hypothetical protein
MTALANRTFGGTALGLLFLSAVRMAAWAGRTDLSFPAAPHPKAPRGPPRPAAADLASGEKPNGSSLLSCARGRRTAGEEADGLRGRLREVREAEQRDGEEKNTATQEARQWWRPGVDDAGGRLFTLERPRHDARFLSYFLCGFTRFHMSWKFTQD